MFYISKDTRCFAYLQWLINYIYIYFFFSACFLNLLLNFLQSLLTYTLGKENVLFFLHSKPMWLSFCDQQPVLLSLFWGFLASFLNSHVYKSTQIILKWHKQNNWSHTCIRNNIVFQWLIAICSASVSFWNKLLSTSSEETVTMMQKTNAFSFTVINGDVSRVAFTLSVVLLKTTRLP